MEHEKLIKITEHDWHYKMIQFCWGIDPKMFRNLCPYFWLTVASIVLITPMAIIRALLWVFKATFNAIGNLIDKVEEKNYKGNILDGLSEADIYYLANVDNISTYKADKFARFKLLRNYAVKHNVLQDVIAKRGLTPETIESYKSSFDTFVDKLKAVERRVQEKKMKEAEKAATRQRKTKAVMYKISEITQKVCTFGFAVIIMAVVFVMATCITDFLVYCLASDISFANFYRIVGIVVLSVITILAIAAAIIYLHSLYENRKNIKGAWRFVLYPLIALYLPLYFIVWFLYEIILIRVLKDFIVVTVFGGILEGFVEGFNEFGGIFKDYFDASYSDYCPGINWEEEK